MKLVIFRKIYFLMVICLMASNAWAAGVDAKKFDNPDQEQIYSTLISELRCLVCQNQTIADSNAALAKDLRQQVFELIQKGQTEEEIKDYMLARYGDFVLYKPPFKLKTSLLWIGPFVFLFIGIMVSFLFIRQRKKKAKVELDVTEKQKIRQLLDNENNSND